eukprot:1054747-Pyramimonas_sp.AAC.1
MKGGRRCLAAAESSSAMRERLDNRWATRKSASASSKASCRAESAILHRTTVGCIVCSFLDHRMQRMLDPGHRNRRMHRMLIPGPSDASHARSWTAQPSMHRMLDPGPSDPSYAQSWTAQPSMHRMLDPGQHVHRMH